MRLAGYVSFAFLLFQLVNSQVAGAAGKGIKTDEEYRESEALLNVTKATLTQEKTKLAEIEKKMNRFCDELRNHLGYVKWTDSDGVNPSYRDICSTYTGKYNKSHDEVKKLEGQIEDLDTQMKDYFRPSRTCT